LWSDAYRLGFTSVRDLEIRQKIPETGDREVQVREAIAEIAAEGDRDGNARVSTHPPTLFDPATIEHFAATFVDWQRCADDVGATLRRLLEDPLVLQHFAKHDFQLVTASTGSRHLSTND
jgi:hypothetical protein